MSYRYNTIDIIMGVGLYAIPYGALLLLRAIQERLGTALVHVVQVQRSSEQGRGIQQERLASLIFSSVHQTTSTEATAQPTIPATSQDIAVTSTKPASWPEIPMSDLMAAGLMLATGFWGSLSLAAQTGRPEFSHS